MNKLLYLITLTLIPYMGLTQTPKKAESVSVNGKSLYYEVYGHGTPLIMLHGYSLASNHWKPFVSDFEQEYEVYLIDLTGHGKSDPFKETLSVKSVSQDLNALLDHLGLTRIQAIGFSFGGDVLFQLSILNPDLIQSMITIGALGTWDVNDFPQYQESYTFENVNDFPWMKASHASDNHIKALMEQFKNYTVHVTDSELKSIQPEVFIVLGDDDIGISLDEVVRARKHLQKSDLWILPNTEHGAHQGDSKEDFIRLAKAFLNKE